MCLLQRKMLYYAELSVSYNIKYAYMVHWLSEIYLVERFNLWPFHRHYQVTEVIKTSCHGTLRCAGLILFQSQVGIHNNDTNSIMCSNSRQASGGMPVYRENVQGEMS